MRPPPRQFNHMQRRGQAALRSNRRDDWRKPRADPRRRADCGNGVPVGKSGGLLPTGAWPRPSHGQDDESRSHGSAPHAPYPTEIRAGSLWLQKDGEGSAVAGGRSLTALMSERPILSAYVCASDRPDPRTKYSPASRRIVEHSRVNCGSTRRLLRLEDAQNAALRGNRKAIEVERACAKTAHGIL